MRQTISKWVRSTGSFALRYSLSNREDSDSSEFRFSLMFRSIQPDSVLHLSTLLRRAPQRLMQLWRESKKRAIRGQGGHGPQTNQALACQLLAQLRSERRTP